MKNLLSKSHHRRSYARSFIALSCALCVGFFLQSAQAFNVRNYFLNPTNQAEFDTNYLVITKISTNILASGGVVPIGVPVRTAYAPYTNLLAQGFYSVTSPRINGAYVINVYDGGTTFIDYTNILHSGYNTYVYSSGTAGGGSATNVHLSAGVGVTVVTNGTGDWTVSAPNAVTNNQDSVTFGAIGATDGDLDIDVSGGTITAGANTMSASGFSTAGGSLNPTAFYGNAIGLTNGSPGLATNSATATDGQALVKRGDKLNLETIAGGSLSAAEVAAIMGTNAAGTATTATNLATSTVGGIRGYDEFSGKGYLPVYTHDGLEPITHFDMVQLRSPMHGYNYVGVHTPYPAAAREWVNVVFSRDGYEWVRPTNLTFSVDGADTNVLFGPEENVPLNSGWFADPEITILTNGNLLVVAMGFNDRGASFESRFYGRTSADGLTWSSAFLILQETNTVTTDASMFGPELVYLSDGKLRAYFMDNNYGSLATTNDSYGRAFTTNYFYYRDLPADQSDLTAWGAKNKVALETWTNVYFPAAAMRPFHFDVKRVNNTFHFLMSDFNTSHGRGLYYFTASTNGDTVYANSYSPAVRMENDQWDKEGVYKPAMFYKGDGKWDLYLSTYSNEAEAGNNTDEWRLKRLLSVTLPMGGSGFQNLEPIATNQTFTVISPVAARYLDVSTHSAQAAQYLRCLRFDLPVKARLLGVYCATSNSVGAVTSVSIWHQSTNPGGDLYNHVTSLKSSATTNFWWEFPNPKPVLNAGTYSVGVWASAAGVGFDYYNVSTYAKWNAMDHKWCWASSSTITAWPITQAQTQQAGQPHAQMPVGAIPVFEYVP